MLDSLLDKTAMYSQFVSTNIQQADAGSTRSGAKRASPAPSKPSVKRVKKEAKEKFDLSKAAQDKQAADELREAGQPTLMTHGKVEMPWFGGSCSLCTVLG
jgi:predicted DNA-binding helix-hairpin-helix protein